MRATARSILAATAARSGALHPAPAGITCCPPTGIHPGGDASAAYFSRLAATAVSRRPGGAEARRRSAAELARMLKAELELNESLATTEREMVVMRHRHLAEARAEDAACAMALPRLASQQAQHEMSAAASLATSEGFGGGGALAGPSPSWLACGLLPPRPDSQWRQRQRLELEEMQEQLQRQRRAQADRCASLHAPLADETDETDQTRPAHSAVETAGTRAAGGAPPPYMGASSQAPGSGCGFELSGFAGADTGLPARLQQVMEQPQAAATQRGPAGDGGAGGGGTSTLAPAAYQSRLAPSAPECEIVPLDPLAAAARTAQLPPPTACLAAASGAAALGSGGSYNDGCGCDGQPGDARAVLSSDVPPSCQFACAPSDLIVATPAPAGNWVGGGWAVPGRSSARGYRLIIEGPPHIPPHAQTPAVPATGGPRIDPPTHPPAAPAAAAPAAAAHLAPAPVDAAAGARLSPAESPFTPADSEFGAADSAFGTASPQAESRSAPTESVSAQTERVSAPTESGSSARGELYLQYEVEVPPSVPGGGCFAAHVDGVLRLIEVPLDARAGAPEGAPLRLL
eukprot:scaffold5723_cov73-Isochrysis_galbana.AAC.1